MFNMETIELNARIYLTALNWGTSAFSTMPKLRRCDSGIIAVNVRRRGRRAARRIRSLLPRTSFC
jgi:hypothetical protein